MPLKYQRPRGTHDLYPGAAGWEDDSVRCQQLEDKFRALCGLYGYSEIRTPVFEDTELFKRSVGEETDIVSKEMYTFQDKGDRSLTLRPESTAPVLRALKTVCMRGAASLSFTTVPHTSAMNVA